MSDTLTKIRAEIEKLRDISQEQSRPWPSARAEAMNDVLAIIDRERAAEERKPRGEWRFVPDIDDTFWAMNTQDEHTRCEVYLNQGSGMFVSLVTCYGYAVGERAEFPTLTAAQLAAEDAMEKMEGGQ